MAGCASLRAFKQRAMTSTHQPSAPLQANFINLYADIAWYGALVGSSLAFLSVYAARLGASPLEIGLLTAGPALVNLTLSLPFGRWLEGRSLVGATYRTSLLHRLAYPIMVALPWAFPSQLQVQALVALTLLMSIAGSLLGFLGAAAFARAIQSQLFQVRGVDPLTVAVTFLVLFATALAACYIPARRAARVDAVEALRYE